MVTWIQTKWFNFEFYGFLDICFFTDIHTGWSQLQKFMVKVWTWIFKTINDFVNWNLDGISNSLTDINCTFLEYKTLKWILQGHIFYTQAHRIKSRLTMVTVCLWNPDYNEQKMSNIPGLWPWQGFWSRFFQDFYIGNDYVAVIPLFWPWQGFYNGFFPRFWTW